MSTTTTTATTPLRIKGHALETIAARGGIVGACACGENLSPEGMRGQSGRSVGLGLFTGFHAREAIREAHEAHKLGIKAAKPVEEVRAAEPKPMTKAEARAFVKRSREALRWLDQMLDNGGTEADWNEACGEAVGSVAHLQDALETRGINGLSA